MLGLGRLGRTHRFLLGVIILLIVDVIWVVSSELTSYIFREENYSKPFFTTYVKTVMFSFYLFGFLVWKPWREQCCIKRNGFLNLNAESEMISPSSEPDPMLGSPIYVPVKYDSHASGGESDDAGSGGSCRSVRFSNLSEVRQLSDMYALEHNLARLSYQASVEAAERLSIIKNRLPIKQVLKLACWFCVLWFFANYTYQIGLEQTQPAIVNVLSSTSGLFTLICAAVFPSGSSDRFTLSKLVAVLISLGGIALVCKSDMKLEGGKVPVGAIWSLVSAGLYAFYLVLIKRKVDNEDRMDIPMFFGFVGMFCMLLLWPGFFILNAAKEEVFEWPKNQQWMFILINGAIGTVLSEFLWLLGCFLTSSLVGTLSLSLVIPMSMLADGAVKNIKFGVWFYVGSVPIVVSFVAVSLLTHWDSWDPVLLALKKLFQLLLRRKGLGRVRELDREQTASLITEESHH